MHQKEKKKSDITRYWDGNLREALWGVLNANVNPPSLTTPFLTSLEALEGVVSWL